MTSFDLSPRFHRWLTWLANLGFLWVLVHYGMGGWQNGLALLLHYGWFPWVFLGLVVFLLLYRSDYRSDLPLFLAGLALGYWGEWWGTTRGVWTYWNGATPPDYLPPLWGIGLLTVCRLAGLLASLLERTLLERWRLGQPGLDRSLPRWVSGGLRASFVILPLAAVLYRWPLLAAVDWRGRLDAHFIAGLLAAALLIPYRFDLRQDFLIYVCGMLLGGMYEYLGTAWGEWTYITREVPPVWIVPLWGLAAVSMHHLAGLLRQAVAALLRLWRPPGGRQPDAAAEGA